MDLTDCLSGIYFVTVERKVVVGKDSQARVDRISVINSWSISGVKNPRKLSPVEKDFRERVGNSKQCFIPVSLNDSPDFDYQREIGYLIDAFDMLPTRPDFAFESAWKALESETLVYDPRRTITNRMIKLAEKADFRIVMKLAEAIPVQACKYLFKIIVTDYIPSSVRGASSNNGAVQESRRLDSVADKSCQLSALFDFMRQNFDSSDANSVREGALLLRHALRGDPVHMGDSNFPYLEDRARAYLLIPLYLYSTRNDRFHADFSSPFISGVATVRTYTLPYHAFLVAYHMLLEMWLRNRPNVVSGDINSVIALLEQNLFNMNDIFGKNW